MKQLKSRGASRISANEALKIAAVEAPALPPAQVTTEDRATTLNLRLRISTVMAITQRAKEAGLTQKQVVCRALAAAGIAVAPDDLEDRTPRRKF